jgi:hypothetical protein|tara:strand:- start:856 stop:1296 length:441 start_codon:yes stop_codon:yes gene_type:complete
MSNSFNYPQDYEVYWEKWVDVYQEEIDEIDQALSEFEDLQDLEYDIDPEMMEKLESMANMPSIKTIMTPFGMMPLTEQSLASNHFKFWVGHTNFKLLKKHSKIIGSVEGIESVDILTPYRFRISVAKLFVDRDAMAKVRKALLEST